MQVEISTETYNQYNVGDEIEVPGQPFDLLVVQLVETRDKSGDHHFMILDQASEEVQDDE